jgi:hypothetical protein
VRPCYKFGKKKEKTLLGIGAQPVRLAGGWRLVLLWSERKSTGGWLLMETQGMRRRPPQCKQTHHPRVHTVRMRVADKSELGYP